MSGTDPRCDNCNHPLQDEGGGYWSCTHMTCRKCGRSVYWRKTATIPYQATEVESALLAELQRQTAILEEIRDNTSRRRRGTRREDEE